MARAALQSLQPAWSLCQQGKRRRKSLLQRTGWPWPLPLPLPGLGIWGWQSWGQSLDLVASEPSRSGWRRRGRERDSRSGLSAEEAQSAPRFCSGLASRVPSGPASGPSSHRSWPRGSSWKKQGRQPSPGLLGPAQASRARPLPAAGAGVGLQGCPAGTRTGEALHGQTGRVSRGKEPAGPRRGGDPQGSSCGLSHTLGGQSAGRPDTAPPLPAWPSAPWLWPPVPVVQRLHPACQPACLSPGGALRLATPLTFCRGNPSAGAARSLPPRHCCSGQPLRCPASG